MSWYGPSPTGASPPPYPELGPMQLVIVALSLALLLLVLWLVKRRSLREEYTPIWVIASLAAVVLTSPRSAAAAHWYARSAAEQGDDKAVVRRAEVALAVGSSLRLDPAAPAPFPAPPAVARSGLAAEVVETPPPGLLEPFDLDPAEAPPPPAGPVTVCMASYPARRAVLGNAVERLLDQTRPPDRVLIHWNGDADPPPLPADRRIELHRSRRDLADLGKLRMAARVEEGYILTADDDLAYPRDYVETLVAGIERYRRRAVVGLHGAVLPLGAAVRTWDEYLDQRRVHSFRHGLAVDLPVHLVGTGTAGYHADTIRVAWTALDHRRMADLHLAVLVQERGVPMVCLARPDAWLRDAEAVTETAIWSDALDDEELQGRMLEVLGRCPDWALHRPGRPPIHAADLDLVRAEG